MVTERSGISKEILVFWHGAEIRKYLIIRPVWVFSLKYKPDLNSALYFMLVGFCTYSKEKQELFHNQLPQAGPNKAAPGPI